MPNRNINKMVLGTAQLGFDYGIANPSGKPSESEAMKILETAWASGIRCFDTAPGYNSEPILGRFVKTHGIEREIKVLTKVRALNNNTEWKSAIHDGVIKSLEHLGSHSIEVLFFHDVKDSILLIKDPQFFLDLLNRYPVSSLGISVYEPDEMQRMKDCSIDLAFQFPYNILDRRFENNTLSVGKRYARSVFLQGLLASKHLKDSAPKELKETHSRIHKFYSEKNISLIEQAIRFVARSRSLDFFLVGVDDLQQLKQILAVDLDGDVSESVPDDLRLMVDDSLLDPRRWS